MFTEIQNILSSLKAKDIQPALNWCNANKSKLTKLNSQIRFLILRQQFIEIYSQGNLLEAVRFSRENFTGATADQIKDVMILLAVKSQNLEIFPKLLHLLSSERWTDLINEFQSVFFQVYCMKSESPIEILFQTGLMSLKTPFCYHTKQKHNLMCPVCCDEIGKLAQPLPASQHPVSSLLCRITGEIMDHLNQPLALPNGQVYSEKAVLEQVRANGKFVCPITNKEYKLEECKKVYIC